MLKSSFWRKVASVSGFGHSSKPTTVLVKAVAVLLNDEPSVLKGTQGVHLDGLAHGVQELLTVVSAGRNRDRIKRNEYFD